MRVVNLASVVAILAAALVVQPALAACFDDTVTFRVEKVKKKPLKGKSCDGAPGEADAAAIVGSVVYKAGSKYYDPASGLVIYGAYLATKPLTTRADMVLCKQQQGSAPTGGSARGASSCAN